MDIYFGPKVAPTFEILESQHGPLIAQIRQNRCETY